jgi:hypothetical protein
MSSLTLVGLTFWTGLQTLSIAEVLLEAAKVLVVFFPDWNELSSVGFDWRPFAPYLWTGAEVGSGSFLFWLGWDPWIGPWTAGLCWILLLIGIEGILETFVAVTILMLFSDTLGWMLRLEPSGFLLFLLKAGEVLAFTSWLACFSSGLLVNRRGERLPAGCLEKGAGFGVADSSF